MNALAASMIDDLTHPHGTPEGFARGCKTEKGCPESHVLSCKAASAAARHDYQVHRMFKAGATPAQIAVYLSDGITPDLTPNKEDTVSKPPKPKPSKPAAKPKATPKPSPPAPAGSTAAIRRWARAEGYEVADRGPIPPVIRQKYNDAHFIHARDGQQVVHVDQHAAVAPLPEAVEGDTIRCEAPDAGALTTEETAIKRDADHDIAHRSDLLDETRERMQPDPATTQDARPDWSTVAAQADVAAANRRADRAQKIATRALEALNLALEKWTKAADDAETWRAQAETSRANYQTVLKNNVEHMRAVTNAEEIIARMESERRLARRSLFRRRHLGKGQRA